MFESGSFRWSRPLLPLLVACALLDVSCQKTEDAGTQTKRSIPSVVVARAVQRDVPIEVEAPLDLRPVEQVDVGSKILGYLDAVLVDRGDRVRKGQPIALVRPSDLPDQLAAARSAYTQVQTSSLLAKTNYERASKLQPAGVMSEQELEQSKTAVAAGDAAEAASKAQLEALAVRLGETRITSPIDGVVAMRKLDPGALVGPSASGAIATIIRADRLRAYITVVERYAAKIVVGMRARVTLDAAPDEQFVGEVVRVSPAVDPNTRTLEAEVQIENRDGRLRPGMYGRGYIQLAVHPNATVVPINAITYGGKAPQVFVVTDGRVSLRAITVGAELDHGKFAEVVDGLKPGELVVVAGADSLIDGTTVKAIPEKTSPAPADPATTLHASQPSAKPIASQSPESTKRP